MQISIIYGIIGFVIGAIFSGVIVSGQMKTQQTAMAPTPTKAATHNMEQMDMAKSMTMTQMVESLKNKTGDAFDKGFIQGMIEHHEGAVSMAQLAEKQAKHEEIKNLSQNIISAQNAEIIDMKAWQKTWGY